MQMEINKFRISKNNVVSYFTLNIRKGEECRSRVKNLKNSPDFKMKFKIHFAGGIIVEARILFR